MAKQNKKNIVEENSLDAFPTVYDVRGELLRRGGGGIL